MSFADYVRALGRGPSFSRSLTQVEAQDAMRMILGGEADPHAVGALLMLLRYRGEVADEVAGFVSAMRDSVGDWAGLPVALDWPSYAAGRSRGLPFFLLAAKLLAQAGMPVLLHGWNSHQNPVASVRNALGPLGIPVVSTPEAARLALAAQGIAYVPIEEIAPKVFDLLQLRAVFGLRSPINTCLRVLNPARAAATVQGVFHPPYRALQADAAALLGQPAMSVIKGGGGEFERHPSKDIAVFGLRDGAAWEDTAPVLIDESRRLSTALDGHGDLLALWRSEVSDDFAEAIVTGTAALALHTLGRAETLPQADTLAVAMWAARHTAPGG